MTPLSLTLSSVGRISWAAAGAATARSATIQIVLAVFARHGPLREEGLQIWVSRQRYGESRKGSAPAPNGLRLQAPQEVQQVLLVRRGQRSIALDDAVRLGGGKAPILAPRVSFDRFDQVAGAAIVQEEQALPQAPQRRGSKFVRPRVALHDVVGQARAPAIAQKRGRQHQRA